MRATAILLALCVVGGPATAAPPDWAELARRDPPGAVARRLLGELALQVREVEYVQVLDSISSYVELYTGARWAGAGQLCAADVYRIDVTSAPARFSSYDETFGFAGVKTWRDLAGQGEAPQNQRDQLNRRCAGLPSVKGFFEAPSGGVAFEATQLFARGIESRAPVGLCPGEPSSCPAMLELRAMDPTYIARVTEVDCPPEAQAGAECYRLHLERSPHTGVGYNWDYEVQGGANIVPRLRLVDKGFTIP